MRKLLSGFLLGLTVSFLAGCVSGPPTLDPSIHLDSAVAFDSSRAFREAVAAQPGNPAYEQARINYLLERVSKSPYNFIRNGSRYSGKRGAVHLRWKYYFRSGKKIKTAEAFIEQIATFSKRSGQPYQMEFLDGQRCPLQLLLLNELKTLDQELEKWRRQLEEAPEAPDVEPLANP